MEFGERWNARMIAALSLAWAAGCLMNQPAQPNAAGVFQVPLEDEAGASVTVRFQAEPGTEGCARR